MASINAAVAKLIDEHNLSSLLINKPYHTIIEGITPRPIKLITGNNHTHQRQCRQGA